jgi:methionine-rich copper-binding protein CopC
MLQATEEKEMNPFKSIIGGFAALALVALPNVAFAHAHLESALPAADSTVHAPLPDELRLDFTEAPELAFTKVTLAGPDGSAVETGPLSADPADATMLIVPLTGELPNGAVTVTWKAVAGDGHKSEGSYTFTVAP